MRVILFLFLVLCACSSTETHTSTLPPFVRDLRTSPAGLEMIQCETVFVKKTTTTWVLWDRTDETSYKLSPGNCWRATIPTGEQL